jgi:hypothetical protein
MQSEVLLFCLLIWHRTVISFRPACYLLSPAWTLPQANRAGKMVVLSRTVPNVSPCLQSVVANMLCQQAHVRGP